MIDITPTAATKVKELLEESGKADHALRIFVRGMSCSGPAYGMALDNEPRDDDTSPNSKACGRFGLATAYTAVGT